MNKSVALSIVALILCITTSHTIKGCDDKSIFCTCWVQKDGQTVEGPEQEFSGVWSCVGIDAYKVKCKPDYNDPGFYLAKYCEGKCGQYKIRRAYTHNCAMNSDMEYYWLSDGTILK